MASRSGFGEGWKESAGLNERQMNDTYYKRYTKWIPNRNIQNTSEIGGWPLFYNKEEIGWPCVIIMREEWLAHVQSIRPTTSSFRLKKKAFWQRRKMGVYNRILKIEEKN